MPEDLSKKLKRWSRGDYSDRPSASGRSHGRARVASSRAGRNRKDQITRIWKAVVLAVPFVLVVLVLLSGESHDTIAIKETNLCPANDKYVVGKTFVHIDLTEPLNRQQRKALKDMLASAADNLKTSEHLFISQMQTDFEVPRARVQDFCNPDISRINDAGKYVTPEKCPVIIANKYRWAVSAGKELRQQIRRACIAYQSKQEQVVKAAERYEKVNVEQKKSYIIGGIEDVMHAANGGPVNVPTRLILFSDMLQNADWFSQYNTAVDDWTVEHLKAERNKMINMREVPDNNLSQVLVCYLPSAHRVLGPAKNLNQHKKMWREYFGKSKVFEWVDADGCAIAAAELMQSRG